MFLLNRRVSRRNKKLPSDAEFKLAPPAVSIETTNNPAVRREEEKKEEITTLINVDDDVQAENVARTLGFNFAMTKSHCTDQRPYYCDT
jgi:hypothetical protein